MEIRKSFGNHPHREGLTFITSVTGNKRTISSYTPVPLTRKQFRRLKRNARSLTNWPSNMIHEHPFFNKA
ncbi:hypothetical protein PS49_8 [Aeromonas phage PS49]